MEIRLEHAETTASSALSGRQAALNVGNSVFSNLIARISASSSTRRGRIDTVRHWKSRCAYSRFSSSIPSSVRLYVSSNVFGKSFNTLRILAGNVRHNLSIWQTTQRNLQYNVSIYREAKGKGLVYDLHAIRFGGQRMDNKLLVLFFPSPHAPVRVHNRLDVLDYVLLLPDLIMK